MNDRVRFGGGAAEDSMGWDAGMSKRCYYETLEVERAASDADLKTAFRKLAMKWHPDRNPGDTSSEQRFKEINEAYEVLKDPDKRAAYDRFGHAAFEQGMGGGAHDFGPGFGSAFADIFEGIFGMAGGRGRGNRAERGADLRYNMEITLEEAFAGKTAQVRIPTSVSCDACSGTGAKAGTKPKTCPHCGGAGRIRHAQGFFTLERTCTGCQGRGQVIDSPCPTCSGSSRVTRERTLSVNTHAFFQRDGADLHCRVPISMVQAALGGEFEVPTIDGGKTRVKVPEGTQSGRRFRLHGKGMPVLRARQTGDMYVQVVVETPQKLTKRQRELLNEFDKLSSQDTHPESHGFFGKMRELLGGRAGSA